MDQSNPSERLYSIINVIAGKRPREKLETKWIKRILKNACSKLENYSTKLAGSDSLRSLKATENKKMSIKGYLKTGWVIKN